MHPERRIPARGVRHLNGGNRCPVMTEVTGIDANPRAPFHHGRPQSHPLQVAHAVGSEEQAGPDLTEGWSLLV